MTLEEALAEVQKWRGMAEGLQGVVQQQSEGTAAMERSFQALLDVARRERDEARAEVDRLRGSLAPERLQLDDARWELGQAGVDAAFLDEGISILRRQRDEVLAEVDKLKKELRRLNGSSLRWVNEVIAEREEARAQVKKLWKALLSLQRRPGCWCEVNPEAFPPDEGVQHLPECAAARDALSAAEESLQRASTVEGGHKLAINSGEGKP
jgi:predicted  nucleic acid-binding Zn-ribbon protein